MKIYFDMDDVLVNFTHNASKYHNNADLNHPSKDLSPEQRVAKKQFWLSVEQDQDFWRTMPVTDNIETLLSVAKSKGELFILSKTPGAKHFTSGEKYVDYVASEKRKWALKNLGKYFDDEHIIICRGPKSEEIHPTKNDVLIDDRVENITEWESNGGTGILFINATDCAKKLAEQK